jgi:hypothetical protein
MARTGSADVRGARSGGRAAGLAQPAGPPGAQGDVTVDLARQVLEAVQVLVAGFERAAARDRAAGRADWLGPAVDAEADHFYRGVLCVVLRLLFLLFAEDHGLLPVDQPAYARDFGLRALHERLGRELAADRDGASPRVGAYGQVLGLFRAVFGGARRGALVLPARGGRLFDPAAFPFLEGRTLRPHAPVDPVAPSAPGVDDGTVHGVLDRLIVLDGQPLRHRTLDVEVIGSVYESLIGFHVQRGPLGLAVRPGNERRRTASHYTPASLADAIVRRTLAPLLTGLGDGRTADQVLGLKVCDPAMGSGAFLLATCRALGAEVVAAWSRHGALEAIVRAHGDAPLHARRLVADRCLYGVDRNAMAVELARLSLWLVARRPELPFTFVDHALRHGDSLVGLDRAQLEAFHWSPSAQAGTSGLLLRAAIDERADRARLIADVCVGAFFAQARGGAREQERRRRLALVEGWLALERLRLDPGPSEQQRARVEGQAAVARAELQALADAAREQVCPLHWWIELPEVFSGERAAKGTAGFDAVVGNPPFLGGKRTSTELGAPYADWLAAAWAASKNADLSSRFFLRASGILGAHGTVGLIATNTIGQGETRRDGLARLLGEGLRIYDAVRSMPWPGDAAVSISIVHLAKGVAQRWTHGARLDGQAVRAITSHLRAGVERPDPSVLAPNAHVAFVGCFLRGDGFVLSEAEAEPLRTPAEAPVVRPFLGGDEVNTSPTHAFHRYCIDFTGVSLEQAQARFPGALAHVARHVRPYRESLRDSGQDGLHRLRWWQFASSRDDLREQLAGLSTCLVVARNPTHLCVALQPTSRVFSDQLVVIALSSGTAIAVLQSRVHRPWAYRLSSSLGEGLRYSVSDCFETFPFPEADPRAVVPALEAAGRELYEARARFMVKSGQGLTRTYAAMKDPSCGDASIAALRRMHEATDRAVLDAYGWGEVEVPPYCPRSEAEREAQRAFEDEVVERLYALNVERARGRRGG